MFRKRIWEKIKKIVGGIFGIWNICVYSIQSTPSFPFILISLYVCSTCLYVSHTCAVLAEARRGCSIPWQCSYRLVSATCGYWELKLGPLWEQQTLLTTEPTSYGLILHISPLFSFSSLFWEELHPPGIALSQGRGKNLAMVGLFWRWTFQP